MKTSSSLKISIVISILIAVTIPAVIAQSETPTGQLVTVRKLKDIIVEGIAECKSAAPAGDQAALRTCLKGKIVVFLKEQSQRKRAGGAIRQTSSSSDAPAAGDSKTVKVVHVVDGDTIEIEGGQRVRYIGIDTPETVDPRKPVQCFGKEASTKNRELVEGHEVRLEKDISDTDRYGRLLRYVYVGDTFINELLVSEGYASASSYPPDIKYQDRLQAAEQAAQAEERGLWEDCLANTPAPSSSPSTSGSAGACQYSCSGPDRDCSAFSDPAEAQDFFDCCGFTATNDPMKLDALGIGDGTACESVTIKPSPTRKPFPKVTPTPKPTPIILPEEQKPSYERPSETSSSSDCGSAVTCGGLSSCGEAYHLNDCGQTRLDGDRDGTPCEALCK